MTIVTKETIKRFVSFLIRPEFVSIDEPVFSSSYSHVSYFYFSLLTLMHKYIDENHERREHQP